jgi:protein gp37
VTAIEWTDEVWNPVVGCSKTSPGCSACYAIGVAHRAMQPAHQGLTVRRPGERADWTGEVRCLPERLNTPLKWRKPRRIFVNSMSDLFHPDVPPDFIARVFSAMAANEQHTFQVLTKRSQRMARLVDGEYFMEDLHDEQEALALYGALWPLPNVHLGVSVESDAYTFRADHLRATKAAVRFLSLEPLLGPLPSLDLTGIDWVIVGGESGPGARPMHPRWVRDIRDRCVDAGIPFHFKQWGAWTSVQPATQPLPTLYLAYDGRTANEAEAIADGGKWLGMFRVGKKDAGRKLDGRTWDEMAACTAGGAET